jgi:hypothetical protein
MAVDATGGREAHQRLLQRSRLGLLLGAELAANALRTPRSISVATARHVAARRPRKPQCRAQGTNTHGGTDLGGQRGVISTPKQA